MHIGSPSLVLVPDTFLAGVDISTRKPVLTSTLVEYIQEEFPGIPIEPVARKYWNSIGGYY